MKFQGTELERQMAVCNLTASVVSLGLEFDGKFFVEAIEAIDTFVKEFNKLKAQNKLEITGGQRTLGILKDSFETVKFMEKRLSKLQADDKMIVVWNAKGTEYKNCLIEVVNLLKTSITA